MTLLSFATESNGYLNRALGRYYPYHREGHINRQKIKKFIDTNSNNEYDHEAHLVILQIIRAPVDTVLSGYNYHLTDAEEWTTWPLSPDSNPHALCAEFMPILDEMQISKQSSLLALYRENNLSFGIGVELQRYTKCEFKGIYSAYDYVKNGLRNGINNINAHSFRLEEFEANWTETVNVLLDLIGVFEDENRRKLMKSINMYNIYDTKARDGVKHHITAGTYDKAKEIRALLGDTDRCNLLKEQTISLDYDWKYLSYC